MNNLVSESLGEYIKIESVEKEPINEASPELIQAITYLAGAAGVVLTSAAIPIIINKLKKSESKSAQKLASALENLGKGAAEGTRKGPNTSLGESLEEHISEEHISEEKINEGIDPALAELAAYFGGTLAVVLAAGGIGLLQKKLAESKSKKAKQFGAFLAKLGKGAAEGTKKAPKSI